MSAEAVKSTSPKEPQELFPGVESPAEWDSNGPEYGVRSTWDHNLHVISQCAGISLKGQDLTYWQGKPHTYHPLPPYRCGLLRPSTPGMTRFIAMCYYVNLSIQKNKCKLYISKT